MVLVLEDGTKIFSTNKICSLLCAETGVKDFISVGDDLIDWLEWEAKELEVPILLGTHTHTTHQYM